MFSNEKQRFWTIFLSAPKAHPPQNHKFYFYCRLAVSDKYKGGGIARVLTPRGGCVKEGGISMIGVVRGPVATVNLASNPYQNL